MQKTRCESCSRELTAEERLLIAIFNDEATLCQDCREAQESEEADVTFDGKPLDREGWR